MVSSADPFCVASATRSSLLDHCIDHHHHGRASVQLLLDQSSSASPSSSSSTSSLSPAPVTASAARNKLVPRSREITSRYNKSTTPSQPEISTRYRSPPPSSSSSSSNLSSSSSSARRFTSPAYAERPFSESPPFVKRAVSAERRRPSPTKTSLENKLSTAAGSDGSSGLPPRRTNSSLTRSNSARSDHLWPTTRNLYSSIQAEPHSLSPRSPARTRPDSRGRSSSCLHSSDHTLKPSPNATQRLLDQRKKTPERKGTPLRHHSSDQSENARPSESTVVKPEPVLKHRWPSSLSILKLYSPAISKSVDLTIDREKQSGRDRSVNMLHSRPTSFSSQVIPRVLPNSSGVFSHTINGGPASSVLRTARKLSLENKAKRAQDSPVMSRRGTPVRDDNCGISTASSRSASSQDLVRQSEEVVEEEEAELGSEDSADETQAGTKSTNNLMSTTRAASVPARCLEDASRGRARVSLDVYRSQCSTSESGYTKAAGGRQQAIRERLTPSSETRAGNGTSLPWQGSPHLPSAYKPTRQQSQSPVKLPPVTSYLRSWPSPTGSKGSSLALSFTSAPTRSNVYTSVLNSGADLRKSKKGLSLVEATYLHRILHNRLLQWRFANARADFVNGTHRQAGEGSKLEEWASIQQDHSNALAGAVEALEATVVRVPVNEGIKADTQAVKEAMTSAVEVVQAVESSVNGLLPKMDTTNTSISELAQVADRERTLLEECGDLLVYASSLEVEERSLRMQLLQFEQEKARVLGHLMAG